MFKSAEWVETSDVTCGVDHALTSRWYLRLDPPAEAWIGPHGSHDVRDERGHLHTSRSWDHCMLVPGYFPASRDELVKRVLVGDVPAGEASGVLSRSGGTWRTVRTELDGQPMIRYERDYPAGGYEASAVVWFDPATRLIARTEETERDPKTGKVVQRTVRAGYRYDQDAPPGTFDLPPADKPLRVRNLDEEFPELLDRLSAEERAGIDAAIRTSDSGWAGADFTTFAQGWYFPRLRPFGLPSRRDWKSRVEKRAARWSHWSSTVTSITRSKCIGVASSSHSFLMVPWPEHLKVRVTATAQSGTATSWEGTAVFHLARRNGSYRIIHWTCPFAEAAAAAEGRPE